MKYLNAIHNKKHLELDRPTKYRFAAFIRMANELNYTIFVQHLCINNFGHSDFSLLATDGMELIMKEAEQMIYEATVQLRLLK